MLNKIAFSVLLLCLAHTSAALDIRVKMLSNGSALLQIDGQQRFLRNGARSPEGVLLVSADSEQAIIEWDGQRRALKLNRDISSGYSAPQKTETRIASSHGGHYVTPGLINGRPVQFMVDTGATSIAMNYLEAERLDIDYRAGVPVVVSTANGRAKAFRVVLGRVSVGGIEVNQVEAVVSTSTSPEVILLGNSYLGKVDMRIDAGVLLLQTKH